MWTRRLAPQVAIGYLTLAAAFSVVVGVQVTATVVGSADPTSQFYFLPNSSSVKLVCSASPVTEGGTYFWQVNDIPCSTPYRPLVSGQNVTVSATFPLVCYKCGYSYTISGVNGIDTSSELRIYAYVLQDSASIKKTFDLATVASVNATCGFRQLPDISIGVQFVWTRATTGTNALGGNLVHSTTESALFIENSTAAGDVYYCHGFVPGHTIVGDVVNGIKGALLATYTILAPPFAEVYGFEQLQYTDGDNVTVSCKALGYPVPTVTWLKRGAPYQLPANKSVTAHIAGGVNVSFDIVSLSAEADRGDYVCVASGVRNGSNLSYNSAVKVLHARSKLAALWPALGIIAQIAVVALIIGVTETVRARKAKAGGGSKGAAQIDGSKKNADAVDSSSSNTAGVTGKQWKQTM